MATLTTTTITTTTAITANARMFATSNSRSAQPVQQERIKRYKDFLTPLLHRRFCAAAGLVLLIAWFDSWFLSASGSLFWSWFPIGPTGIRTLLLFIPCLAVFIVRLANLHIGEQTSASPAQSIYAHVSGVRGVASTVYTILWYVFSGWFFGEVYIFSRSETAELGLVDPGKAYERPRLNENPIFLRCLFVELAIMHALLHLIRDYDRLDLLAAQKVEDQHQEDQAKITDQVQTPIGKVPRFLRLLGGNFWPSVKKSANLSVAGSLIVVIPVYFIFLRYPIWNWSYFFAKMFFHDLPDEAPPTGLLHVKKFPSQATTASLILVSLWEFANLAFDIFVVQAPLKKGEPLTSEIKDARGVTLHKSKDPNGSLLTGLKSKRDLNKSFAFWELYIICTQFENRRKTIYTEVDRADGNTWSQICKLCLDEIKGIQERIAIMTEPVDLKKKQAEDELLKQQHKDYLTSEDTGLKRIGDRKVIEDANVFAERKPDLVRAIGSAVKSIGQSPGGIDPVSMRARKLLQYGTDQILSKEDQARLRPQYLEQQAGGYLTRLLKHPVGVPFRQTFARTVTATILGTPTSKRADITHAVKALAKLTIRSLEEDSYGQVQKDVATIVRTLTEVIRSIEKYVRELQPHWTDVEFQMGDRNVTQVKETVELLKNSLAEIILTFEEYASAVGLTRKDVRDAKEASQIREGPEMRERI